MSETLSAQQNPHFSTDHLGALYFIEHSWTQHGLYALLELASSKKIKAVYMLEFSSFVPYLGVHEPGATQRKITSQTD